MRKGEISCGEFLFDPATGELRRADGVGEAERLPPKPSALLTLLLSRRGEVVSRAEIRASLWPDVEVDFEAGLNFCVRQVRAALGDQAARARYIETLPRRGYRLREPEVEAAGISSAITPNAVTPSAMAPSKGAPARRGKVAATTLILILFGLAAILAAAVRANAPGPLALAILPVHPADRVSPETAQIAELLLLRLGRLPEDRLGVVGPTTTAEYGRGQTAWRRMIRDLELDYLVGARSISAEGETALLAELIRATDGVHVWVEYFADDLDPKEIAASIADGVLGELEISQLEP